VNLCSYVFSVFRLSQGNVACLSYSENTKVSSKKVCFCCAPADYWYTMKVIPPAEEVIIFWYVLTTDPGKRARGHFGMIGMLVMFGTTVCAAFQQLRWTPERFKMFK